MIVLIVGGTGTLSQNVLPLLLKNPQIDRIRLLSRGEHTQMKMSEDLSSSDRKKIDFFVGDVRDQERVHHASEECEIIYHFAAMKSVDKAEYDPWEAVLTNIIGAKNVIESAKKNHAKKAIFISTDKAVGPTNIYGATKLVAEKLFIQANIGKHPTKFSVCRYGNVLGSQGSVFQKWKNQMADKQRLKITHEEMTRFFILPHQAAEFVVERSYDMRGGEVFIPKMKSTTILNMARAFKEGLKIEEIDWIGIRPGEKIHEALISEDEADLVTDLGEYYIRWPNQNLFPILRRGTEGVGAFTSKTAERFTDKELKEMIQWEYGLLQKSAAPIADELITRKNSLTDVSTDPLTPLSFNCLPEVARMTVAEISGSIRNCISR